MGVLGVLAAFAIGASLSPIECSRAEAQPIDLSLEHDVWATSNVDRLGTGQEYATGVTSGRVHPQWIKELESKAWPGFLTGMVGYEDFVMPVGMPVYFEDPLITETGKAVGLTFARRAGRPF